MWLGVWGLPFFLIKGSRELVLLPQRSRAASTFSGQVWKHYFIDIEQLIDAV